MKFSMSADTLSFSGQGVKFGSPTVVVGGVSQAGSVLSLNSNALSIEGDGLNVANESIVNIGNERDVVSHSVIGKINIDDSNLNIYAGSLTLGSQDTSAVSEETLYLSGGSNVLLNASEAVIQNTHQNKAIDLEDYGTLDVNVTNNLRVASAADNVAVNFSVSHRTTNNHLSLKADTVDITGRIIAESTRKYNPNQAVNIQANSMLSVKADAANNAVIAGKQYGVIKVSTPDFSIFNTSDQGNGVGLAIGYAQNSNVGNNTKAFLQTNFSGTGVITADTGIINTTMEGQINLCGNAAASSQLTINAKDIGVFGSSGSTNIKNTSVFIHLKQDQAVDFELMKMKGVSRAGLIALGSSINLQNDSAKGKQLIIQENVSANQNSVSAIESQAGDPTKSSSILMDYFETVKIDVTNAAKTKTFGMRAISGVIKATNIGTFDLTTHNGTAIYQSNYTGWANGTVDLSADQLSIYADGEKGVGLHANGSGSIHLTANDVLNITGTNQAINVTDKEATVNIDASNVRSGQITGDWSVTRGTVNAQLGQVNINGDLNVKSKLCIDCNDFVSKLNLTLGNQGHLTGSAETTGKWSATNITLENQSLWSVTKDSNLSNLTLNTSTVDLTDPNTGAAYKTLRTNTLKGQSGLLKLRVDLSGDAADNVANDRIQVKKDAQGQHKVFLDFQNPTAAISPDKMYMDNALITQGKGSNLTLVNAKDGTNTFSGNGMLSSWNLVFIKDGEAGNLADETYRDGLTNQGTDAGEWRLVRAGTWIDWTPIGPSEPVNPDPIPPDPTYPDLSPILPGEAVDQIDMGSALALASSWYAEESDLRERLGEVRYGSQDGAWVKLDTRKETLTGRFEQKSNGIHLGYDHLLGTSERSTWLVGTALRYGESEQEQIGGIASGKTKQYSAKVYGTWMHRSGTYADLVAQAGHYKQSLEGLNNVGNGMSRAKYSTDGFGVSAEIGHAFTFGAASDDRPWEDHFFIEPQLQLSYFHSQGADYISTTGLSVDQDSADFLTGRAGVVLGKKFNIGGLDSLDKRYIQVEAKAGIEHEFKGEQTIRLTGTDGYSLPMTVKDMFGDRYYYGVNVNGQISNNTRVYGAFEYIEGDEYRQNYGFTLGLKHQF